MASAVSSALGPQPSALILEIGFGYGHFLRHLSATNPDARIIGLEIASECLLHVEHQLDRGDMPNARVLFSRADTALYHLFEPETVDEIHVNFPDPWFKSRHERRRLMQRPTTDLMASRLKMGGLLYLATDIPEYAEMSDEALRETPGLVNTLGAAWSTEPLPGRITTKYERKALAAGRGCHYFAYRRDSTPLPYIPVMREAEMMHMTVTLPLSANEIAARFEQFEAKAIAREPANTGENIVVKALHAFVGDKAVMIECYVAEPTIHQHVGIMVVPMRERPGEYTVGLSGIGTPRPTDGLHYAARKVAEWLATLHPDAKITSDKARSGYVEV
jgi:tRNA (guanine-N7-)-methyltransferase